MINKKSQSQQDGGYFLSQENQRFSGSRKFHFPGLKLRTTNRSKLWGITPSLSNKKGQEHVEMILAFTIFITFIIFLFIFFNPFKTQSNEALVNNIYLKMKQNMSVTLSSVSIRINDSGTQIPISQCFNINITDLGCKGAKIKVIAKDKIDIIGKAIANDITGIVSIEPATNIQANNNFFSIYCSEELVEIPGGINLTSCMDFKKGLNFTVGIIVDRELWSENKSANFAIAYNNNYDNLKSQLLPPANDFKFAIYNETQDTLFAGIRNIPSGVNVDTSTTPIDLLDSNATIKKGVINILVW